MIAAQQYYIEFGTDMNPDRYVSLFYSDDEMLYPELF
jgi:hypothetical protein